MAQQLGYLNDGHNCSSGTHQYTPLRTHIHTHTPLPQADKLVLGLAKFYEADFNYFFVVACELRLIFTYTSTVIYLYAPLSLSHLMSLFMTAPMA